MQRFIWLVVFVCAVTFASVYHDAEARASATDTDAVVAAERAWAKAPVDGDVRAFAAFMSDDYEESYVDPAKGTAKAGWGFKDKATWVAALRSKRETYESVVLRNLRVRFHGDVATVTGEYSQKSTSNGKDDSSSGLYVDTWVKRDGHWHIISSVFP